MLAGGKLVAFPTETVYGLGAHACDDAAVARVFAAKGRPDFNPLIVHVADLETAATHAVFTPLAELLARTFWPGALTLVLERRTDSPLSLLACAGLPTVALRVPAHPVARAVLETAGVPVAAPSANPSGRLSPTTAAHVREGLGEAADMILDGGPCQVGLESTILDATGSTAVLLRPGGIAREAIEAVAGQLREHVTPGAITAPGQLASHYAPRLPLRLNATEAREGETLLAFGPVPHVPNLSPSGDVVEAAANLFAMLHTLDASGASAIAVMPIPEEGLGRAINDRLRRAATPPA